jgi:hypothetical protein
VRDRLHPLHSLHTVLTLDRPVYGVIFLFKYPTGEKPSDTPKDGNFDFEAAENLFFAAQTIQNACGTQALLSVLLNKEGEVEIGPQLKEFKDFTGAFPSEVGTSIRLDIANSVLRRSLSYEAKPSPTAN